MLFYCDWLYWLNAAFLTSLEPLLAFWFLILFIFRDHHLEILLNKSHSSSELKGVFHFSKHIVALTNNVEEKRGFIFKKKKINKYFHMDEFYALTHHRNSLCTMPRGAHSPCIPKEKLPGAPEKLFCCGSALIMGAFPSRTGYFTAQRCFQLLWLQKAECAIRGEDLAAILWQKFNLFGSTQHESSMDNAKRTLNGQ